MSNPVSLQNSEPELSLDAEGMTMPERLDSVTAPMIENAIIDYIRKGDYEVVMDFKNARFLTAAGLRMILAVMRAIKAVDGDLTVRHLHGQPKAMFEACGFDSLIRVLPNNVAASSMRIA